MRDPLLPPSYFKLDQVTYRAVIPGTVILPNGETRPLERRVHLQVTRKAFAAFKPISSDISRYNTLCLLIGNESRHSIRVGLRLIHGTKTFRPDANDISTTGDREVVEPESMREIKFHRECFGTYGFQTGWDDIHEIRIHIALEWGISDQKSVQVFLEGLFGEVRQIPDGPRLTYEGLTRHAVGEENLQSLCSPNRKGPFNEQNLALLIPPPHPYPVESAEEILQGNIMGQKLGLPFSWDSRPVAELEWEHFLHRHHFMKPLVQHFAQTDSYRIVQWINRALCSWIAKFPAPIYSNGGAGASWETLSVAWRCREWLWIFGILWKSPLLEDDTRLAMLASTWETAQSLMHHRGHPNNWLIVESAALAIMGLCFPEFRDAESWFSTGVERLHIELERQFFQDGVHFELSPLYHAICIGALLDVVQTSNFYDKSIPDIFLAVLRKGLDYLASIARPDFTWPALNDSGGIRGDYHGLMIHAENTINKSYYRWVGTYGAAGNPPLELCRAFPHGGITIMRSGYQASSNYALFRSGPPGASHIHRDVLSIEVSAMGQVWLVDPGITSYAPRESTDFYRSAKAHNTILIDGQEPRPDLMPFRNRIRSGRENTFSFFAEGLGMATGIYEGPWDYGIEPFRWARTVISIKDKYWIVADQISGQGKHRITTCWQFAPVALTFHESTKSLIAFNPSGVGFEIRPVQLSGEMNVQSLRGSRDPWGGWVSLCGSDVPAYNCRCSVERCLPSWLLWLLIPFHGADKSNVEIRSLIKTRKGKIKLEIGFPNGRKDILTIGHHDLSLTRGSKWYENNYVRLTSVKEK